MNIKLDIPESFYQGEERCGYYVSPEMKKVWAVELDLIAEFSRVCEKYNIKWYADGGTLLGAARHKGFIPWDDDVDIIMMRDDYNRFCEVAEKEFRHPYMCYDFTKEVKRLIAHPKLYNTDTTLIDIRTKYVLTWGRKKIDYPQSIFIDIFILDNITDDEREFRKMMKRASYLQRKSDFLYKFSPERMSSETYYMSPSLWKRPFKSLLYKALIFMGRVGINPPSYKKYFYELLDLIQSCKDTDTERIANLAFINNEMLGGDRLIHKRRNFDSITYLPFEMLTLPAPSGYEDVLNQLYGSDWREFKITHNHGTFFDPERPYTYYLDEGHHFEFKEFNAHL